MSRKRHNNSIAINVNKIDHQEIIRWMCNVSYSEKCRQEVKRPKLLKGKVHSVQPKLNTCFQTPKEQMPKIT